MTHWQNRIIGEGIEAPDQWRDIPDYEGLYQVSAAGEIRRIGTGRGVVRGRVLKQSAHKMGYRAVQLWANNTSRAFLVHRLVCAAFHGPIPPDHEVNHVNGDKTDNRAENLVYVTRIENMRHAFDIGLLNNIGSSNPASKLTEDQVSTIRTLHAEGMGYKNIAKRYGVTWEAVRNIIKGRSWRAQGRAHGEA